eukprot:3469978-Rhodomonas_salina.1
MCQTRRRTRETYHDGNVTVALIIMMMTLRVSDDLPVEPETRTSGLSESEDDHVRDVTIVT